MAHRSSMLCLACSGSLPPRGPPDIFMTRCCSQPICHKCLNENPRLARYDPCLACLRGVGVVRGGSKSNLDGSLKDSDVFVLGDDDDADDAEIEVQKTPSVEASQPRNSTEEKAPRAGAASAAQAMTGVEGKAKDGSGPAKYYIKRGDTLQGIAFKFRLDGRLLCRMNNLPPSTLSTTPHLLHTRQFIVLPSTSIVNAESTREEEAPERKLQGMRERAARKLQTVTKEVDWDVARAYVALAEDAAEDMEYGMKRKEAGMAWIGGDSLAGIATDMYLDDEEWMNAVTGRQ
ncbi:hypothetical protein AX16_002403 [Volvariella volvacea WC 439]|nr:hypothetical protein AX16_002403 [Volvariella volvacea WC 439]